MARVLNNIKLASQVKQGHIKIHLHKNDMRIIKLLIKFNFIHYIVKSTEKTNKIYCNYYYIYINIKSSMRFKNLYRPAALKTISYKELSKNVIKKKCGYILSTTKGFITHHTALKYHLSGILFMVIY
jgi:ribosomal protein S8